MEKTVIMPNVKDSLKGMKCSVFLLLLVLFVLTFTRQACEAYIGGTLPDCVAAA